MKTKVEPRSQKPLEIKHGIVIVKVYAGTNRLNGTDYPQFTVVDYDGAQRK